MENKLQSLEKVGNKHKLSDSYFDYAWERKSTRDSHSSNSENEEETKNEDSDSVIIVDSSNESPKKKSSIKDFEILNLLGKGSYAKVVLARNIYTNKYSAIKVIDKEFLKKLGKEYEVHVEKLMLSSLHHPNIMKLVSTFQDVRKLYFILEYCPNGDLCDLIRSQGKLKLELTKFYAAQIVSALEYLKIKGIYHRDLKPENMVLDEKMNLKICDFATASIKGSLFDRKTMKFIKLESDNSGNGLTTMDALKIDKNCWTKNSHLVGTAEYVSPEVIIGKEDLIGPPVDLWALGCIIYTCLHGKTPFKEKTTSAIFEKILNLNYKFDSDVDPIAKDIISKLLDISPNDRLGSGLGDSIDSFASLKSHEFFKGIKWDKLNECHVPVEYLDFKYNPILVKAKLSDSLKLNSINKNKSNVSSEEEALPIRKRMNTFDVADILKVSKDTENEIVFEGQIQMKSPWFHYNDRYLKLFSKGKLEYYDPDKKAVKGTIYLNSNCEVELLNEYMLVLDIKSRKYVFKAKSEIIEIWNNQIAKVISNLKL